MFSIISQRISTTRDLGTRSQVWYMGIRKRSRCIQWLPLMGGSNGRLDRERVSTIQGLFSRMGQTIYWRMGTTHCTPNGTREVQG